MQDDPDLGAAYALQTPDDSRRLYRAWADTYDTSFVEQSGYVLHRAVASHFATMGGFGPVLDVGAGTGICGTALRARGIEPVDGTDISPEMLAVADKKNAYRTLFTANLAEGLPLPNGPYQSAVSSGTFTHGHIGPDGLDPILAAVRSRAWVVISVNAEHYAAAGFADKLQMIAAQITDLSLTETAIYGPAATGEHAKDTALLVAFRKA